MQPVTVSVDVPTSRAVVYEYLAVLANHEAFTAPMLVDYRCSGPERGVGSHVRLTAVMGGRRAPVDVTVVEDIPFSRITEQNVSARGRRRATGTYALEPLESGGTRISFTYAWQEVPFGDRAFSPVVRAMMARGLQQTMARLARLVTRADSAPDAS